MTGSSLHPGRRRAGVPRALYGLLLGALLWSEPSSLPLAAQQPGLTVTGVVVDAGSGAPVAGAFVTVGERGPRALADERGSFRLAGVPSGRQTLRVQRFGYADLVVTLEVAPGAGPLSLALEPDPLALEGLVVTGGARVAVAGQVRDAVTGEPVPWVSLALSPDAVRPIQRGSSDADGIFRIGEVQTGEYFLRAEALGYESQYAVVRVTAPPERLEIELRPDTAVKAGVARFSNLLRGRRNYSTGVVQAYGQERIHTSAAPSVAQFLETDTFLPILPCQGAMNAVGTVCTVVRGRVAEPVVFIDELPRMAGLEVLASYSPAEIYLVEIYGGGSSIRVYTYEFMQRMARRPRALLPP